MPSATSRGVARDAGVALRCGVPYRIDISCPPRQALDRLVELGALDIEPLGDGLAAIIPDGVTPDAVAAARSGGAVGAGSLEELLSAFEQRPRVIWVMVPPGAPTS